MLGDAHDQFNFLNKYLQKGIDTMKTVSTNYPNGIAPIRENMSASLLIYDDMADNDHSLSMKSQRSHYLVRNIFPRKSSGVRGFTLISHILSLEGFDPITGDGMGYKVTAEDLKRMAQLLEEQGTSLVYGIVSYCWKNRNELSRIRPEDVLDHWEEDCKFTIGLSTRCCRTALDGMMADSQSQSQPRRQQLRVPKPCIKGQSSSSRNQESRSHIQSPSEPRDTDLIRKLQAQVSQLVATKIDLQNRNVSLTEIGAEWYQKYSTFKDMIAEGLGMESEDIENNQEIRELLQDLVANHQQQMEEIESQQKEEDIDSQQIQSPSASEHPVRRSQRMRHNKGAPQFFRYEWTAENMYHRIWLDHEDMTGRERTLQTIRCWVKRCRKEGIEWKSCVTNSAEVLQILRSSRF